MAAKIDTAAPAEGRVWMQMITGLSGPDLCLGPRDKHQFDADEAQRLFDAGFAEYTDAPEA